MIKNILSKFKVNKAAPSRVMIQCRTVVNRDAVRRESIDGVEHIIISSATLPDNIVMNGILYPAEEIANSFESLELTLAPVEHPTINGQFISANDPRAIHDFHAGAFNRNVRRENGRVHIDKFINVAEALKTDRGKRLLDRIEELETNADPRPIHTSVGVFLLPEELDEPQTNDDGEEFTSIARGMVFDHDAILLDSVGAAQPHQGVGIAVNQQGEECRVDDFTLNDAGAGNDDAGSDDTSFNRLAALNGNSEHQSITQIEKSIFEAFERSAIDAHWIEEIFPDDNRVIFHSGDQLFEVEFVIDSEGLATIVGIPLPVERSVTFTPKTNQSEGEAMKKLMLNALKDAGVTVADDATDADILTAYNKLQANQSDSDDDGASDNDGLAEVVANAIKPLAAQIVDLTAKMNSADDAELDRLAGIVANSGKYPALDAESAKLLPVDKLKEMAGNCAPAFGVSPVMNSSQGADESQQAPTEMPS
jgi:hypothetical protein